ncbi:lactonase family protein [Paenibacillus ferrarius]|uniref:lactonase family protein n=1 Tax=Paenibacillus ferrarius TaxID=1469647 RepID=UPI003D2C930A
MTAHKPRKTYAFIGSYADSKNPGVYTALFDEAKGSFKVTHQTAGLQNPTFLAVDTDNWRLYALSEGTDANGQRCGAAGAYQINPDSGQLTPLNQAVTLPATTCHITLDRTNQLAMVASYHGGMVGVLPILEDGKLGETSDIRRHQGASVLPVQDRPRAHSVTVDRNNRFAVVCDLGLDKVIVYKLDVEGRKLDLHQEVQVPPGSGPRHLAFHPSYRYAYVINELGSSMTAFAYDEEQGQLAPIETVSTLPGDYQGDNACADVHISPDGRFLYGSNRGHDSIVVYAIDADNGKLTAMQHESTGGKHPRNFALSPDGRFLLVANKDSNNVVSLARDEATGKLAPTGDVLELSMPVCIKFAQVEADAE